MRIRIGGLDVKTKVVGIRLSLIVLLLMAVAGVSLTVEEESRTRIGGWPNCAAVNGDIAYVAQSNFLAVLDVSTDPMQKIGGIDLDFEPSYLGVTGDRLVAFRRYADSCMQVIDISDPLNPVPGEKIELQSIYDQNITRNGSVICHVSESLISVFDLSAPDPVEPWVRTEIDGAISALVNDSTLFVGTRDGLELYSLEDPANPAQLSTLDMPEVVTLCHSDTLLLAGLKEIPDIGVAVVDIRNPENPQQLAMVETAVEEGSVTAYKTPVRIRTHDHLAFIAAGGSAELFVLNLEDPANPPLPTHLMVNDGRWSWPASLDLAFPYAYMGVRGNSSSFIKIDVSDATAPDIADIFAEPSSVLFTVAQGDILYVAGEERLWIYQVLDPETTELLASYSNLYGLTRLAVQGDHLYATRNDTLVVLTVSDPAQVEAAGLWVSETGPFQALEVTADRIFLLANSGSTSSLEIVDAADPAQPEILSSTPLTGKGRAIETDSTGTQIYLAWSVSSTDNRLAWLDATDPQTAPQELGTATLDGVPLTLAAHDSFLIAGSNKGFDSWSLEMFSIADPTLLDLPPLAKRTGPGNIYQVEVIKDAVFATVQGDLDEDPEIDGRAQTLKSVPMASLAGRTRAGKPAGMMAGEGHTFIFDLSGLGLLASMDTPSAILFSFLIMSGFLFMFLMMGYGDSESMMFYASLGILFLALLFGMGGNTGVSQDTAAPPANWVLQQNYPNPFNPETTIEFTVDTPGHVLLEVFDVRGQHVATLMDEMRQPGQVSVDFDAHDLPSGVYLYRLTQDNMTAQRRMVLIK
jgi:hypothetical protein